MNRISPDNNNVLELNQKDIVKLYFGIQKSLIKKEDNQNEIQDEENENQHENLNEANENQEGNNKNQDGNNENQEGNDENQDENNQNQDEKKEKIGNLKIDFDQLKKKIEEDNRLEQEQKTAYKSIIDNHSNGKSTADAYIEIQSDASYNFYLKKYKVTTTDRRRQDTKGQQSSQEKIRYYAFRFRMQPTNYTSNVNEEKLNYLKYLSSSKFILRGKYGQINEVNYQIEIPLSFKLSTGVYEYRKPNLKLYRSQNEVIPINIEWKNQQKKIIITLYAKDGINNVAIKAVLYSRIIIKESNDYVAQTHKILKEDQITRENTEKSLVLTLDNIEKNYPPLFFGDKIISHHIVILTLDFKIRCFSDLFKKNFFQIQIPVDLDPKVQVVENLTKLYRENYFDKISVLDKTYQDYQKFI
ncbi:unnamed protein product (macronuclear) [Paramecium tetraurelia]|uniref:Arrestin-like N-terminal domain-containing protein n=1 Tax=Paramecium tetraurelia TaxID=5888 RepID=A0E655_PARTE|nr:uncharacterized protein GSPATT00003635001 [Paramecium tetraurelia]CAK90772.1 unnamed protein product [Paramecium tetraurelia]|eukprot:XP_001458169.1 hypothetical protein (macronuclear) [Paramecium tetraurelia strain d4-2]